MTLREKTMLLNCIEAFKKMGEADRQRAHQQDTQFKKGWVAGAGQAWLSEAEELENFMMGAELGQIIKDAKEEVES